MHKHFGSQWFSMQKACIAFRFWVCIDCTVDKYWIFHSEFLSNRLYSIFRIEFLWHSNTNTNTFAFFLQLLLSQQIVYCLVSLWRRLNNSHFISKSLGRIEKIMIHTLVGHMHIAQAHTYFMNIIILFFCCCLLIIHTNEVRRQIILQKLIWWLIQRDCHCQW